jgi:1,4-dihydroxy-2-naphthoate octaprenyltransferase
MPGLKAFAGVARAPFLLLPVCLVAAGTAAAWYHGAFDAARAAVALVGLIALHMTVNILNEWSDYRTGIDLRTQPTPFSGGSGTLPRGEMRPGTALAFAALCATIGLGAGLWLLGQVGPILIPFLVAGALCVLPYTPWLTRLGVGEVAAGLGLGLLPVAGTAVVQSGTLPPAAWAAAAPAFFMTFNLLLLNEFPDEEADRSGGRRHLVILLGREGASRLYAIAAVAVPTAIVGAVFKGLLPLPAIVAAVPSLLLVGPLRWALDNPHRPVPLPALAANVQWNLATNLCLAAGLAAARLLGMAPG